MLAWKAHDAPVYDLAFTPDGQRLITSGNDETVRTWDLSTQCELRWWPAPKYAPLAVSADGQHIGNGGHQVTVRRADGSTVLQPDHCWGRGLAFSPTSPVLVVHGLGPHPLRRWNVLSADELPGGWGSEARVDKSKLYPTGPVAYHPDGSLLIGEFSIRSVSPISHRFRYEPVLLVWNAHTGEEVGRLGPLRRTPACTHLCFSPDGLVLVALYGQHMIVWGVASSQILKRRVISDKHFKSLAFTKDGNRLLTASREAVVRVWDTGSWQPCLTYQWDIGNVWCVGVSADCTVAAAGGSTGKVVVWDLE